MEANVSRLTSMEVVSSLGNLQKEDVQKLNVQERKVLNVMLSSLKSGEDVQVDRKTLSSLKAKIDQFGGQKLGAGAKFSLIVKNMFGAKLSSKDLIATFDQGKQMYNTRQAETNSRIPKKAAGPEKTDAEKKEINLGHQMNEVKSTETNFGKALSTATEKYIQFAENNKGAAFSGEIKSTIENINVVKEKSALISQKLENASVEDLPKIYTSEEFKEYASATIKLMGNLTNLENFKGSDNENKALSDFKLLDNDVRFTNYEVKGRLNRVLSLMDDMKKNTSVDLSAVKNLLDPLLKGDMQPPTTAPPPPMGAAPPPSPAS